jgi:CBS domain containing-hemolysin-like protein
VLCEFSLVSIDRSGIERAASQEGDTSARRILETLKQLTLYLSGIQLAVTGISLVLGYVAEPSLRPLLTLLLGWASLSEQSLRVITAAIALAIATCLQMVVGELIPKNLAIARPESIARKTVRPLTLFVALFRPVIRLLTNAATAAVRLFGVTPRAELMAVRSLDELELLIESSRAEGSLLEEEFALLARSINFRGKAANDAMVPRVSIVAIDEKATLQEFSAEALRSGHSRLPVERGDVDHIVGIAHVKDSYRFSPQEKQTTLVESITAEPLYVPESIELQALLTEMRRETTHLAVVLDEYGGTAGIITIEDILEEIVGEIEDEYDRRDTTSYTAPAGGVHVLSGMLHHSEVEEATGLEMPDEGDFETLGGFIPWLVGHIPSRGEHAAWNGWEFKVVEMDGNRVSQVLVVGPPDPEESR